MAGYKDRVKGRSNGFWWLFPQDALHELEWLLGSESEWRLRGTGQQRQVRAVSVSIRYSKTTNLLRAVYEGQLEDKNLAADDEGRAASVGKAEEIQLAL